MSDCLFFGTNLFSETRFIKLFLYCSLEMCFGQSEEDKVSKRIQKEIELQKKVMKSVLKLLLLGLSVTLDLSDISKGTGESGKSTFFKQMKVFDRSLRFF